MPQLSKNPKLKHFQISLDKRRGNCSRRLLEKQKK